MLAHAARRGVLWSARGTLLSIEKGATFAVVTCSRAATDHLRAPAAARAGLSSSVPSIAELAAIVRPNNTQPAGSGALACAHAAVSPGPTSGRPRPRPAAPATITMEEPFQFDMTRRRILTKKAVKPAPDGKCVVYWMSRDQRAQVRADFLLQYFGARGTGLCFACVTALRASTAPELMWVRCSSLQRLLCGVCVFSVCCARAFPLLPTPCMAKDNWALLYAHYLAAERGGLPVVVCFSLVPKFLEATIRMYGFMLRGLKETEGNLRAKNIPFHLLQGWPEDTLPAFIKSLNPAAVVCDMSPLKVPMQWVTSVAGKLDAVGTGVPMYQVDAHNVVPVWEASPKQETAARTIRPKITKLLGRYLTAFPELPANAEGNCKLPPATDWDDVIAGCAKSERVPCCRMLALRRVPVSLPLTSTRAVSEAAARPPPPPPPPATPRPVVALVWSDRHVYSCHVPSDERSVCTVLGGAGSRSTAASRKLSGRRRARRAAWRS